MADMQENVKLQAVSCPQLWAVDDIMHVACPIIVIAMIGTTDQPCWLAQACKSFFFLLTAQHAHNSKSSTLLCAWLVKYRTLLPGGFSNVSLERQTDILGLL